MFDNLLEQLAELKIVLSDTTTEDPNEQPDTWGHVTPSGRVLSSKFNGSFCACGFGMSLSRNTDIVTCYVPLFLGM